MKKLFFLFCLCAYLPVCSQTILFKVKKEADAMADMKLFVRTMDESKQVSLSDSSSCFLGELEKSNDGFYVLYGVTPTMQMQIPLYLPAYKKEYTLPLTFKGKCPQVNYDKDNQALSAFNDVIYTRSRFFWTEGNKMQESQLLPFLRGYQMKADSIVSHYGCSAPVKDYLMLWAASQAYSDYESIPRSVGIKKQELTFSMKDFLGDVQSLCNHPMAAYFYSSVNLLLSTIPNGSLMEKMDYLYQNYTEGKLRNKVTDVLMNGFLNKFNYAEKFDEGQQELTAVIEKYSLSNRYLDTFKAKRSTVRGALFPENTQLVDSEGNAVDFSSLKGSYVYIDLWASWCVPCQKEIPFLQSLEKEMTGKNVKFVSISLDRKSDAWKKAMGKLNLHGLQWHDSDGKLAEALNVKGIPHFLIYDKEGRLYMYNAPRPSARAKLMDIFDRLLSDEK